MEYLRTTPKDSIIAGDPLLRGFECIPLEARRPVLISRKLYQPWDRAYFREIRERMFRVIRAYFGESREQILALHDEYGVDYLLVDAKNYGRRWGRVRMAPFDRLVLSLRRSDREPAVFKLPDQCTTFREGSLFVYDLGCVASVT